MKSQRVIPPGSRCLTVTSTCEKFDKKANWLWKRVKTDPDFPQPIYLDGRPLFLEGELDAYIQKKANEGTGPRGPALTAARTDPVLVAKRAEKRRKASEPVAA